ncbi:BZ3500_MvSof-1268-A1-R1_Chr4-3g07371 [Microbotryum saponariae]|uniref:Adenylyl cyclase-associated protein n=1 Tax=Microbotryum saponariae TaxID=289078 RepID=A0A2X0LJ06_9BASI|nr:BZ3500_MvSof-1268-A1-R1_Chr4-3g07371 [Microbotryum saponariae]SDA07034.1 BZ3501_MvSof-1269-A2-R1_Chr4-2g07080 [Microbotryum saponariae]
MNTASAQGTPAGIPATGVGSLNTLLRRLEAATARLEDIAVTSAASGGPHFNVASGASAVVPSTLAGAGAGAIAGGAAAAASATGGSSLAAAAGPAVEVPRSVAAFDEDVLQGALAKYLELSKGLGGLIADQSKHVQAAFNAQRAFILMASACTKIQASDPSYMTLLKATQQALMSTIEIKDKNRASPDANQLTVVAEGIPALGWVTLDSKPGPHVGEYKDSADFWVNRIVKAFKDTNPKQVEWARSFSATLDALRKYVMANHTTGLTWNPKGIDPAKYSASPAASAAAAAAASGDMSGVFAALNKGEDITSGLKKVDKSEMTHKNPELRAGGVVSAVGAAGKGPTKPPKPSAIAQKKPPILALEGNKWLVENYDSDPQISVTDTSIQQTVNVFNCKASVLQVKGKVNAISIVNSPKLSVLLESTVSALSISSSPGFTVQILGKVPTILVDGTDGGMIYLSKESLGTEIITAKTSALNISLPVEGEDDGVFEERAVPEQLKTVVVDGKLVTTVVEHSG